MKGSLTDLNSRSPASAPGRRTARNVIGRYPTVSGCPRILTTLPGIPLWTARHLFQRHQPVFKLSTGISTALSGVSARIGSSASASISNPNISAGRQFHLQLKLRSSRLVWPSCPATTGCEHWRAISVIDMGSRKPAGDQHSAQLIPPSVEPFQPTACRRLTRPPLAATPMVRPRPISTRSQLCVTGLNPCLTSFYKNGCRRCEFSGLIWLVTAHQ